MRRESIWIWVCLLVSGTALAQSPTRGQPDPAFNAGRPRIVAATGAGLDQGFSIVRLSSTRYAVADVRASQHNDAIVVVDTTPESATVFDVAFTPLDEVEQLTAIAAVGSRVVLGGSVALDGTRNAATLQMRDIGTSAIPTYVDQGSLIVQPGNAAQPALYTNAVAAEAVANGSTRIWQAITSYTPDFTCSGATLHRLDHAAGAFTERASLDLSSSLARFCIDMTIVLREPRPATDPVRSMIIAGTCADSLIGTHYTCLTRVLDDGASLRVDATYGNNGLATYGPFPGVDVAASDMTFDAAGNVVGAILRTDSQGNFTPIVVRFRPNGMLDPSFANGGTYGVNTGPTVTATASGIAIAANGVLQIAGTSDGPTGIRPYVTYYDPVTRASQFARTEFTANEPDYQFAGYIGVIALAAGGALAVGSAHTGFDTGHTMITRLAGDRQTVDILEYHHVVFDHYFVTAIVDEMRKLDDGTFAGWQRTGQSFAALPVGAIGALDVCRFFSVTFAPKSSHFYTPIPSECQSLKGGQVWGYEGLVFALQLPDGAGNCPTGTAALFRLYNNGQGAAPNHRYTVSEEQRAAQAAHGWIGEGTGAPPVFACVPA
jgi:hypothetical protein